MTSSHTIGWHPVYPIPDLNMHPGPFGLTKRELFAVIAMHAEFSSCGGNQAAAYELAAAAAKAEQTIEQRIAHNALRVADALIAALTDDLGVQK